MTLSFRQIYAGLHLGQPLPLLLTDLPPLTHWVGRNVKLIILRFSSDDVRRAYQDSIQRACRSILNTAANCLTAADTYTLNFNRRNLTIPEKAEWAVFWNDYEFFTKTLTSLREIAVWASFPAVYTQTIDLYLAGGERLRLASIKMAKCLKVIQRFKHYHTAKKHIIPKYMHPLHILISPFLAKPVDFRLFSLYVCREIRDVVDQDLTERFVSCPQQGNRLPFHDFATRTTKYFTPPPLQIYYKKYSQPHPTTELFVILRGNLAGEGGYKRVYLSILTLFKKKYTLPLQIKAFQAVVSMTEGIKNIDQVKKGLQNHAAVLGRIPQEIRRFFASLPLFSGQTSPTTFQSLQIWYQGDLLKAAENGQLPENIYGTSFRSLKLKDFLSILLDVCEALRALHLVNWVHRDVKAKNILVYYERRWRGVLADFDLSGKEGYYLGGCNYPYWSKCAQHGIISKESADGYGLIIALGEVFFLHHIQKFIDDRKLILTDAYDQLLVCFLKRHTLNFLAQMAPSKTSQVIDHVAELVRKLPDTAAGDKHLYHYLSLIAESEETKIYRQNIHKLLVELNMYKMIHSFIKTCVEQDTKIYQSALSDPNLKTSQTPQSNQLNVNAFTLRTRKQLQNEKGGNIFSIDVIQEKIKIMYRTLESGDVGKTDHAPT